MHGDDQRAGGLGPGARVGMGGAGVEVDRVAWTERGLMLAVLECELAVEYIKEFEAGVHVRLRFWTLLRHKLGEVGVHVPVGNHVAETLEEVGGRLDPGLRQTHAILAPMDTKNRMGLGLEEVGKVLGENHGNAGEVAESWDHAAGFQLGKKAGRQAGVFSQLDEAHGFFETQTLDALADVLFGDEALGGLVVHLRFLGFLAANRSRVCHAPPEEVKRAIVARIKICSHGTKCEGLDQEPPRRMHLASNRMSALEALPGDVGSRGYR